ncbi:hypothetical protein VPH35_070497 [Triticum aestivum]
MKRRRGPAPPPAGTGQQRPTPRRIAETSFGFALFNFHAMLIEQPNAMEVVWLREYRTLEDNFSAINQDTGVNQSLTQMIIKYHCPGQRVAVAKPGYKKKSLKRDCNFYHHFFCCCDSFFQEITCLYDPTVMELMWGIQICFASFVPSADWCLTGDDLIPVCQGLQNVLTRYGCNYVNPEMVNERIVMLAHVLFKCHSFENDKSGELHHAAALIKDVSGIDTDDWSLRKIATALNKMWRIERVAKSCKISEDEVSRLVSDADKYEVKLDKDACLKVSRQMLQVYGFRAHTRKLLKMCVMQAKEAYEAE